MRDKNELSYNFDVKMIFYSHANKTHFHKKGFALSLVMKVRVSWNQEMARIKASTGP